jgi:CubicO group peptidase (beta-lactamase class C family)
MKNILIFIIFLLTFQFGFSQDLESQVDAYVSTIYKSNEPGAAVLIAKQGKPIYRKAFGNANLELGVAMAPINVFEIGSITKQFTAISILMLEEQGKLKIDDEITKYIQDYPTLGKTITIHHLLNHTSGIKSYTGMERVRELARNDMTPTELIDVFKNEPMDFDPGDKYLYNNSGYILLGHIIEVISGQSYEEFIEKHIFEKLGMNSSYYGKMTQIIPNRAAGYQNRDGYVNAEYLSLTLPYAAGSIMSNVDDLLKWQNALRDNTLISKASMEKAIHGSELNDGSHIGYGYGLQEGNINGSPTYHHGGGIFGYTTMGIYIPEEDVFVSVLTNCDCNSPTGVATKVAAMAIGKPFPDIKDTISLSQEKLNKWTGAYEFKDGAIRFITLEESQLISQREGSTKFKIYPMSAERFIFEEGTIEYQFSMNDGKKQVVMKTNGEERLGNEIDKSAPAEKVAITLAPKVLTQYIGKYELQPGFVIEVTTKGSQIFAQATGQPQFEMFAESEDNFFLKVVPASMKFSKNDDGTVESLTLHQGGQIMPGKKIE